MWQEKANCVNSDASIFFHDEPSRYSKAEYKKLCEGCPVISACLETALIYGYSGVWGGTTDSERRKLYKKDYCDMLKDDHMESGLFNDTLKV